MSDTITINLYYGGFLKYDKENNKFKYIGGSSKSGIVMDPDYITWSVFDGFAEEHAGGGGAVQQIWYKLTNKDMSAIKGISYLSSDAEINQMCDVAMKGGGEIDLFMEQLPQCEDKDAEEGEEGEGDVNAENEVGLQDFDESDSDVDAVSSVRQPQSVEEQEEEIVAEDGDDARFAEYLEEIRLNENVGECNEINGELDVGDCEETGRETGKETLDDDDDDAEMERQCRDPENPEAAVETDDEWEDFCRKETATSRTTYSKEKAPYLWLMQTFKSGDEFKNQLLRYVLKTNYDVKLCRWEKNKLAAVCTTEKCPWKIYCSLERPKQKWMVKSYVDGHNHFKNSKARMLKQGTIAKLYKDEARRRPGLRWTDIKDEIMMRYNLSVSKWICSKARRMALDFVIETQREQFAKLWDFVIETQREQFAKLWDYELELRKRNKNITTEIVTIPRQDGKAAFDRFYICFENLRNTWKKCCRPIIGLDGAFLKWELKGEILAAVGRDADNRIFPIAWAIVRVEDTDSWTWFVEKLKTDLGLGLGNGLTIISDKQKGLMNAVPDLLPNAEHRHCARHIFANWKKVYKEHEYEDYFWAVAYSSTVGDYQYNMDALKAFDEVAYTDLLKTEPKTWCRAWFSHHARCEDVCNNLSESYNRTIKEARKLPLINMLEEVRRMAMKRITRRREMTRHCAIKFPPNVMEIFEKNRKDSKFCSVIKSSESLYEVMEPNGGFEVCLPEKHCACNQWNLTGIPCRHAIYVITEHNRDPEDYIDPIYLTSKWQETYEDNIRPVNGERLWEKTGKYPIQIPDKRRMPGRPKNHDRIKEAHESSKNPTKVTREGRRMTCSNCKQIGHNKGTCDRAPVVQTGPKRKRGRPRKAVDDPWSIQNAPKKRNAQSQSTPTSDAPGRGHGRGRGRGRGTSTTQSQSTPAEPTSTQPSTAPAALSASTAPAAPGRGRGRGRVQDPANPDARRPGRPRGRARARTVVPRCFGCYVSPFTGQVFDVWGSRAVDMNGPPPQPQPQAPSSQDF